MKFEIFTKEQFSFIPKDIVIIKNQFGWLFLFADGAQWYMNHTQDSKDIEPEGYEKFLKKLVKAIKEQKKLI